MASTSAYSRTYYRKNKKRILTINRIWRKANQEFVQFMQRLRFRKLTLDQFHARYESQNFCCAVCSAELFLSFGNGREWNSVNIDHNHKTGQPRGLTCKRCDYAIGALESMADILGSTRLYIAKWVN